MTMRGGRCPWLREDERTSCRRRECLLPVQEPDPLSPSAQACRVHLELEVGDERLAGLEAAEVERQRPSRLSSDTGAGSIVLTRADSSSPRRARALRDRGVVCASTVKRPSKNSPPRAPRWRLYAKGRLRRDRGARQRTLAEDAGQREDDEGREQGEEAAPCPSRCAAATASRCGRRRCRLAERPSGAFRLPSPILRAAATPAQPDVRADGVADTGRRARRGRSRPLARREANVAVTRARRRAPPSGTPRCARQDSNLRPLPPQGG